VEALGLLPVVGDIVEILGIGADLLKHGPAGLDVGQVLFALIFAAPFRHQSVLAPNAFQCGVADGQIKLANLAACAESRQGVAQLEQLSFQGSRCF